MTEIALAAGFSSIRRFNAALRETYDHSPTELRSLARRRSRKVEGRGLTITLAARPPFDWDGLIEFLAPRSIPGVELVRPDSYRRTFRIGKTHGVLRVTPVADRAEVCLNVQLAEPRGLIEIVERTRRLFDLDADPGTIRDHLRQDRRLRRSVDRRPGLRVPGAWDAGELAVRAVLGQQVTVAGATTLAARIAAAYGEPLLLDAEDGLDVVFPPAEVLAEADLTRIGLTRARQEAVRNVARACGGDRFESCTSLEELVAAWTAIPGIGGWTAHYIAMRAFREPDAFPASDLGLRKALRSGDELPAAAEVTRLAEAWRPWRAYAAMHLWRSLPG